MNKHLLILGIAVLLICIGLSGCTNEDNSQDGTDASNDLAKFVGIWVCEESGAIYIFSSDGAFSFDAPGEENEGTYEVNDEKLWFTYTFPPELEGEVEGFDYSFSDNDTTFIISPLGYPEYQQRVPSLVDDTILHPTYELHKLFDKIGTRKANLLWKQFLKNNPSSKHLKLYVYINLIMYHHLLTISTDELPEYEELLQQALSQYFKKNKICGDNELFYSELEKYKKEYNSILKKTVIERRKMGYYTIVNQPSLFGKEELIYFDKSPESIVSNITDANESSPFSPAFTKRISKVEKKLISKMKSMMNSDSLDEKKETTTSFFEEQDFFKGFDKELNLLGYDDRHQLYKELHDVAIAFDVPKLL